MYVCMYVRRYRVWYRNNGAGRVSVVSVATRWPAVFRLCELVARCSHWSARRLLLLPDLLRLQITSSTMSLIIHSLCTLAG